MWCPLFECEVRDDEREYRNENPLECVASFGHS